MVFVPKCCNPLPLHKEHGGGLIVGRTKNTYIDYNVKVPCGQCIACRLNKSREWQARCLAESLCHERSSFLTLTFSEDCLSSLSSVVVFGRRFYSLEVRPFQLFIKRLRKRIAPARIRYLYCGEYGENTLRPHFHALIFGYQFPDLKFFKKSGSDRLYTSDLLSSLWQQGHCLTADISPSSVRYVIDYIVKGKIDDKIMQAGVKPPFICMSRRPGIGFQFFDNHRDQILQRGYVLLYGKKYTLPRFFYEKLEEQEVFDYKRPSAMRRRLTTSPPPETFEQRLSRERRLYLDTKGQS